MKYFCNVLKYFSNINVGDGQKEETDDDSYDSSKTQSDVASNEDDSDEFDTSDNEPLSNKVSKRSDSPEFEQEGSDIRKPRKRGRPRGKTKAKTPESLSMVKVVQRHVRRDRVDEECARLGIVYKKWQPLNPKQKSHPSVRDIEDSTVIPDEQEVPEWCILCPRNKYLRDNTYAHTHYLRMHHKKLLVVDNAKMLACKCSEIRSHGSDRSARNLHFHCSLCYHPFKSGDLLATHMLCHHTDIMLSQVRHLMRGSNPHRSYDYENDD